MAKKIKEVEFELKELKRFEKLLGSLSGYRKDLFGIRIVVKDDPERTALLDELADANRRRQEILDMFS